MAEKKILVTGSKGLVGSRFVELYPQPENLITPDLPEFNLCDKSEVSDLINKTNPQVILHFAAFTDVSAGENQRGDKKGICWQVNVEGTNNLLSASTKTGCFFVQISTDMVFPGDRIDPGPYTESHQPPSDPNKLTWYGYSKSVAENLAIESKATIVRIIYPVRANFPAKLDYLRKPLQLYDQKKLYPLFTDQYVSLTFIDELCLALQKIIRNRLVGIYHVSSPDTSTPFALISYLLEKSRGIKDAVQPSSLDQFLKSVNNPARYPKFGGLQSRFSEKALDLKFSSTTEIIDKLIEQGITC
jgi:dTDP-4-dehydrorhamnose reductase